MHDIHLGWQIEEACFAAWPALKETTIDNWVLRTSGGLTRRANSANPLQVACGNSGELIKTVEDYYQAEGHPAIFRIPSLIDGDLPGKLNRLGYKTEGESLVLHGPIHVAGGNRDAAINLSPHPSEEWFAVMLQKQKYVGAKADLYRRIVASVSVPALFAILKMGDAVASVAFGAIHNKMLCLESVITDEAFRGQGLAKRMIGTMIAEASPKIDGVCLQVQADNEPAKKLYKGLGLREQYRYHYQVRA